jgi:hypothetical protein
MKQTVTILDRKNRIPLFRLPKPGSVAHRHLGKGLTVLGDGDILQLPFEPHDKEAACRLADGCALDEVATAPNWLLNYGAGATVRVIEVRDIKITDIVVDPNHRPLIPGKVAEIGESIAEIGQTNPITVTPRKDGKFDLVSGNHRRAAAKSLAGPKSAPRSWREIRPRYAYGPSLTICIVPGLRCFRRPSGQRNGCAASKPGSEFIDKKPQTVRPVDQRARSRRQLANCPLRVRQRKHVGRELSTT